MKLAVFGALLSLTMSACAHKPTQATTAEAYPPAAKEPPETAPRPSTAEISGPSGVKGEIAFKDEGKTIHVVGEFTGLPPNTTHGIHVHENGSCDGDKFAAAGSHYNPWKTKHGGEQTKMRHAGDLGNIVADANGVAKLDERIPSTREIGTFGGKSVIIHAGQDDEHSQPAGNSGDKIACGLIKQKL